MSQSNAGRKIRLGDDNIEMFHNTLKADVELLASLNIMDYSLLVRRRLFSTTHFCRMTFCPALTTNRVFVAARCWRTGGHS
jgi:hypothetical protein